MTSPSADPYEVHGLWPIRIELPSGRGFTLWGGAGQEDDRLLAVSGRLQLFADARALRAFVLDERVSNLSERPGFTTFREACRTGQLRLDRAVSEHALIEMGRWLAQARWNWHRERAAAIIHGLNLLWDASRTLEDEALMAHFRRGATPLAELMDALSFADEAHLGAILGAAPRANIRNLYWEVLISISWRTSFIE